MLSNIVNIFRKEMKAIRLHSYLIGLIYSFEIFVARTSIFISILGYVLLGNYVTAEKIFAITAIYNCMRPVITILFSISLASIAEVNVSIKRLQNILAFDEKAGLENPLTLINGDLLKSKRKESVKNGISNGIVKDEICDKKEIRGNQPPRIVLKDVCAKWSQDTSDDTLHNINLDIHSNQLLAIIGPVGSGKSSILNLLLKELPVKSGKIEIHGKMSYASQEPWLFAGNIRQNILFGETYNEERYQRVVEACALKSDFDLFAHGDKTLVGEKGKSLSGGQKARINLARCVYKIADIYLLDDPLSAVDANVGKHLYEKCVEEFLTNKICILVTHQLQYLKNADKIIIMNDGEIQSEGKYRDLQSSGLNFAKMLEAFHTEEIEEEKKRIKSRQNSEMEMEEVEEEEEDQVAEKENQASGTIKKDVYWKYLRAGGGTFAIGFLIFLFIINQIVANGAEYFVTHW